MKKIFLLAVLVILMHPGIDAQDSYLTVSDNLITSIPFQGIYSAIDISEDDIMYALAGDTVYTIDIVSGTLQDRLSVTGQSYNGFPAFLTLDPHSKDIWVGYTTIDNVDDRIYKYDAAQKSWEHAATFPGNFDLAFRNDQLLVSGLDTSRTGNPNAIWLMDKSGKDEHRLLIETGGYSSGLDIDSNGNLYYATSLFSENSLLKWDDADIDVALASDNDTLNTEGAMILASLPAGAYDIDLDSDNNLVFNCNNFVVNFLGIWDGDNSYDTLATTDQFLTHLASRGNVRLKENGNQVFALAYGNNIAEVHFDIAQTMHSNLRQGSIKAYPNPAMNYVKISTQNLNKGLVTIFDMNGRVVLSQEYQHSDDAIDISSLSPGNYLLILRNDELLYRSMIQKR